MYLLIVGSRSLVNIDLSLYVPENVELIISGGAKGIDSIAEQYADKNGISKLILRPQYRRYGKAAPLIRNDKMIEIADSILAIWDGKSAGTNHTIKKAKKLNKPVKVITILE